MSQPIDLNLSSQPFRNNTLPWICLITSALFLLGFTYWNISSYRDHTRMLAEIRDEKTSIAAQLVDLEQREQQAFQFIRGYDLEGLTIQTDKANEVIGWKAFSWTRLFNRMEVVQPWNVHMRSIQPLFRSDSRDRSAFFTDKSKSVMVAVEGVSKDRAALFDFETKLFEDPHFSQVEPEEYDLNAKKEAIFTLRFRYYPLGTPGHDGVMTASQETGAEGGDDAGDDEQADPGEGEPVEGSDETAEPAAEGDLPRIQRPPRGSTPAAALEAEQVAPTEAPGAGATGDPADAAAELPMETVTEAPMAAPTPTAAPTRSTGPSAKPRTVRRGGASKAGSARKSGQPPRIKRPVRSQRQQDDDDRSKEPPGNDPRDDTSEEQAP